MWVRGLKLLFRVGDFYETFVAPYVGAWIETMIWTAYCVFCECRTLCGCVD